MQQQRLVRLVYLDLEDKPSERRVRPLACLYWGKVWTLSAWCELREDFRTFRVDRIEVCEPLDATYAQEPGRTLADLMRRVECGFEK